jgi:hypothetical protein
VPEVLVAGPERELYDRFDGVDELHPLILGEMERPAGEEHLHPVHDILLMVVNAARSSMREATSLRRSSDCGARL